MPLTSSQLRYLRGLAHGLKPVVYIGHKGATASVMAELEAALRVHELVKIKLAMADRVAKRELCEQLAKTTGAEVVQRIGHVLSLYRRNPDKPKLALPD